MRLKNEDLLMVVGGSITATFLNSIARLLTTVIDVGKMIGSSLRRISHKNYC